MAISNRAIIEMLPKGTWMNMNSMNTFFYKEFRMDKIWLLLRNRPFDWDAHITHTFVKCMKPMTDRMMRVV
jgi:hypothetical protein